MRRTKTHRGFGLIEFKDYYNIECSIQKSSIVSPKCIWFGCNEANPRACIRGKGWQPVPFPQDTLFNTRMHLTRKQVIKLMPILLKFILFGNI